MKLTLGLLKKSDRAQALLGLAILALGAAALLSLVSYSRFDATWFHLRPAGVPTENWVGRIGATLAELFLQLFGAVAFLVAALIAWFGASRVRQRDRPLGARVAGSTVLVLALASLLQLLFQSIVYGGEMFAAGGYLGSKLGGGLQAMLNRPGALLVTSTVLAAVVILSAPSSFGRATEVVRAALGRLYADLSARTRELIEKRRRARKAAAARPPVASPTPGSADVAARPVIEMPSRDARPAVAGSSADSPRRIPVPTRPPGDAPASRPSAPQQRSLPMERATRGYALPPLDLLKEPEDQSIEGEHELLERARHITDKLQEFSVGGTIVAVHPGPVVTTFEFKPDAGVKYSKITSMNDDLSLALKAESVRIDRMPGRSTVGIEVPNRKQETIYPRELIGSERFRNSRSKLTLALGKDVTGEGFVAELERMPHLLIAGATGAGKSVGLNGMIVSLLYKSTPRDLRFIMIDTKMIELGVYADIPHLLVPVVTDPKHAASALKWAVREMEQRYRKLASVGVRNLARFNALLEEEPGRTMDHPKTGEPVPLEHMPYIVIVIDEMADLMMVSSAEVEEAIMRLAQMARAVGIHLVLATQRPSVDVITGTIKANFPSRIAFRVSQRVDSRTIIDQQGAEHLLGRGDMLFLSSGASRVMRLHTGYITEPEISRITSFLRKMSDPDYDEDVLKEPDERPGGVEGGERDEMYLDAVRTVIQEGKCSITLIQRRLQLGYARAARIVDMMEHAGVVSPGEGSKPREVLVGAEELETMVEARTE